MTIAIKTTQKKLARKIRIKRKTVDIVVSQTILQRNATNASVTSRVRHAKKKIM